MPRTRKLSNYLRHGLKKTRNMSKFGIKKIKNFVRYGYKKVRNFSRRFKGGGKSAKKPVHVHTYVRRNPRNMGAACYCTGCGHVKYGGC